MARFLAILVLATAAAAVPVLARAQSDFQRHALTVSMIEKARAATRDVRKLGQPQDDDADEGDMSVEALVKKLDGTYGVRAVLARHGLSTRDYVLTTLALFQAGMYLTTEASMERGKAAQLLASYPAETRANIELLRRNPGLMAGK